MRLKSLSIQRGDPNQQRINPQSKEKSHKPKSKPSKHHTEYFSAISPDDVDNSPQIPIVDSMINKTPHDIAPSQSVGTNVKLSIDEELAREDLWYNIPDIPRDDDLESEEYSAKGVYTLQDFKKAARRPSRSTGKLYEPPVLFSIKKSSSESRGEEYLSMEPVRLKHTINPFKWSMPLTISTLRPLSKSAEIGRISLPKLSKPLEIKSSRKSTAAPAITQNEKQEKPTNVVGEPVIEIPALETEKSTVPSVPQAIIPADKPAPVMYDFNPPAPRRVKRRVILSSKEASTQTSPPPSPGNETTSSPPRGPRPEAIHHPRYYNTAATPRVRPQHVDRATKKLPMTAVNAMLEMAASYTGSDKTWIGTLKNVDAGDDLMIVSKPKVEEEIVESVPTNVDTFDKS